MKTDIKLVQEFHEKFGVGVETVETEDFILNEEAWKFRTTFMQEELDEFIQGWHDGDAVKKFDSLLDLAYVVYGTALMMGITPQQWAPGFLVVHSCNMTKERATSADESKRGSALDVVKPEGWTGPEEALHQLLFGSDS